MHAYLRVGSKGQGVVRWQTFLRGALPRSTGVVVDGDFGPGTHAATALFQQQSRLTADGVVGQQTLIAAARRGYQLAVDDSDDKGGPNWPLKPAGVSPLTDARRAEIFGAFRFEAAPTATNPEGIRILDGWEKKNIVYVRVPQILKATGRDLNVGVHVKVKSQFLGLWETWEKEGLLDRVLTWGGAFVPRFIRGSKTNLSNHSWGTAFDINPQWNALGAVPALVGQKGCVRELVEVAVEHGFYWGNWFTHNDGMHLECFKLL